MQRNETPLLDPEEIERALSVLVAPGDAFEIRILDAHRAGRNWRPTVTYGYFDDPGRVAPALVGLRLAAAKGFYITLNPVDSTLLARSHNRFSEAKTGSTTPDKYILSRRWLLVDFDPVRLPMYPQVTTRRVLRTSGAVRSTRLFMRPAGHRPSSPIPGTAITSSIGSPCPRTTTA